MTAARPGSRRWPLSRIIGVAACALLVFSVAAVAAGAAALVHLTDVRAQVVETLDPAAQDAQYLTTALVDQETGVRGYALSGQRSFLQPYISGQAQQDSALRSLDALASRLPPGIMADLQDVDAEAGYWRAHYAEPTIRQVARAGKPVASPAILAGKADFDTIRAQIAVLQKNLSGAKARALADLAGASATLDIVFIAIAAGLAVIVTLLALGLRATAIRPLHRLAAEARQVADGDFEHEVTLAGPREVTNLAADVNSMRRRILQELAASRHANEVLREHSEELQRSNAELEQFAYIASHDLQEPLRKVASFTQLLQRRYAGQLDERADQYIAFAVDGAKRMQALINDLLAYSRVGRSSRQPALVSAEAALAEARANLAGPLEQAEAIVEAGCLPMVIGEMPLLVAVFQNLLSNALKFRGDKPPRIVITAEREDGFWLFSVSDNGIGVDPEYAERIFVIFQRLHERTAYPGTGIGLAMTRKIIEYFGGRIWLDTTYADGARFQFTLPIPGEDMTPDAPGAAGAPVPASPLRDAEEADD